MHVVITVNSAWNVWNFRRNLLVRLLEEGHDVSVLAPSSDSVKNIEALGARFAPLEVSSGGMNPFEALTIFRRSLRWFQQQKPDVVLSYTVKNNVFCGLAAAALGIPFIANITGLGTAFLSGKLTKGLAVYLYKVSLQRMEVVYFQNEDDRKEFIKLGIVNEEQTKRLPGSGVDLDHFTPAKYPASEDGVTFLQIGRVLADKGVREYVEAARRMKRIYPQARFQLLGSVSYQNRTAIPLDTVEKWVDEGVVDYLGETSDVRPYIEAAHCVTLASYREGAPRTLIEASAMGRPVIATDVPGCRAVVDDGVTGFLCDAKSVDSLLDAMMRFMAMSHKEREQMGRSGSERMKQEYNVQIVVESYLQSIQKVVHPVQLAQFSEKASIS